jgi:hypothetical protein
MLRNLKNLEDFKISATDGEIGHVSGFLVDEESWAIRYLVIDTSSGSIGHKVFGVVETGTAQAAQIDVAYPAVFGSHALGEVQRGAGCGRMPSSRHGSSFNGPGQAARSKTVRPVRRRRAGAARRPCSGTAPPQRPGR